LLGENHQGRSRQGRMFPGAREGMNGQKYNALSGDISIPGQDFLLSGLFRLLFQFYKKKTDSYFP